MRKQTWILALILEITLVIACSIQQAETIQTNQLQPPSDEMLKLAKDIKASFVSRPKPNEFDLTFEWAPLNDGEYQIRSFFGKKHEKVQVLATVSRRAGKAVVHYVRTEYSSSEEFDIFDISARKSALHERAVHLNLPFDCVYDQPNQPWNEKEKCGRVFFQAGASVIIDAKSYLTPQEVVGDGKMRVVYDPSEISKFTFRGTTLQGNLEVEIVGKAENFAGWWIEFEKASSTQLKVKESLEGVSHGPRLYIAGKKSVLGCGDPTELDLASLQFFFDGKTRHAFRPRPDGVLTWIKPTLAGGSDWPALAGKQILFPDFRTCRIEGDTLAIESDDIQLQGTKMSPEQMHSVPGVNSYAAISDFCDTMSTQVYCTYAKTMEDEIPMRKDVGPLRESLKELAERKNEWLPYFKGTPFSELGIMLAACEKHGQSSRKETAIFCPYGKGAVDTFLKNLVEAKKP